MARNKNRNTGNKTPSREGQALAGSSGPTITASPVSPREEMDTSIIETSHVFSGPIPSPSTLREYAEIDPSFANRIIKMAEDEQSHRHETDNKRMGLLEEHQKNNYKEGRLGQIFALVIGLTTIGCGSYVAISGAEIGGSIIGATGVAGLVSAFIWGRQKKQQQQKAEESNSNK